MLSNPKYLNKICALVGKYTSNNGSYITVETADGSIVSVVVDENFQSPENGNYMEIIGAVTKNEETNTFYLQHFVTRFLGDSFDMGVYEKMVDLQNKGKYQDLFLQKEFIEA